jgi:DNA polymerase III subunit delta
MAGKSAAIERALDRADPGIRCYLLYGPDESGSRALAARLGKALGTEAERIDFDAARIVSDPALLADEAASVSLFGGARYIRVEGVTDSCLPAVEALLEAPAAGNPVVLIAGALKKDAKLVKLVTGHAAAMGHASWPPEMGDASEIAMSLAREQGLRIDGEIARRLVALSGADRAVLASEIAKLALYADADLETPREATHDMLDAIGADAGEADLARFVDAVTGGNEAQLDRELTRLASEGQEGIGLVRALLRRMMGLAAARADVDRGMDPGGAAAKAGYGPYSKESKAIGRDLGRWNAVRIARAIDRLALLNRELTNSAGAGTIAADAEFFLIARQAAAAGRRR